MGPTAWHCPHRFGILVLAVLAPVLACTTASRPPRVVPLPGDFEDRPMPVIVGYDSALVAVSKTLVSEIGLPVGAVSVELYPDRASLATGLVGDGFSRIQSERMAAALKGVGRPGKVMFNELMLARDPWPVRIRLLAHELAHTAEYSMADGRRGSSEQWLREGFAEWVAARTTESLGLGSVARNRMRAVSSLGVTTQLDALLHLATTDEWVKGHQKTGGPTSYDGAFLAVDMLIQRHGVEAVVRYFKLCAFLDDSGSAFQMAFGSSRNDLPRELSEYLDRLRGR